MSEEQLRTALLTAERQDMVVLHAALMIAAFVLLLPLGMLAARHRMVLFGGRKVRTARCDTSWPHTALGPSLCTTPQHTTQHHTT